MNTETDDVKAQSYAIMGNCLHGLKQYDKVIKYYDAAKEIYERIYPLNYPNIKTFNLCMDYSFCYFDLGSKENSDEFKEKAKLMAEKIHGSETEKKSYHIKIMIRVIRYNFY